MCDNGGKELREFMLAYYKYLDHPDNDVVRARLEESMRIMLSMFHSYVDNDKPVSPVDMNGYVVRLADEVMNFG